MQVWVKKKVFLSSSLWYIHRRYIYAHLPLCSVSWTVE